MIKKVSISTTKRCELLDITVLVEKAVKGSKVMSGSCCIFIPHTTAGVTINENADPSVCRDILAGLEKIAPFDNDYEHKEGNAAAHIKSMLTGTDKVILIEDNTLVLGTWQGIYFCEFDGPRQRNVFIKISSC